MGGNQTILLEVRTVRALNSFICSPRVVEGPELISKVNNGGSREGLRLSGVRHGFEVVDSNLKSLISQRNILWKMTYTGPYDRKKPVITRLITEFAKKENIPIDGSKVAVVLLGRDTRPSGESLVEAANKGICCVIGAVAIDMGIVTTPELHWMMTQKLNGFQIEIRNSGGNSGGILNEGVGSDFVQKEKLSPQGFGPSDVGIRCASLDGDADRFVYFTIIPNGNNKINLIDGDKILSLFALFIKQQLTILEDSKKPSVGIVQTAYANGASTKYLKHHYKKTAK
ncbi:hypothetical protein LXL04_004739 [Taraxacum kok-saghyz]